MRIDSLLPQEIDQSRSAARALTGPGGYDGYWIGESSHDPWLQALIAAETAPTCDVGTAVVIAFARSPMTVAHSAYDLARYSGGRFILGLGSQIKPHIERRFSMPWSAPIPRMREYVAALRAIWNNWSDGTPLDFRGDFYTHGLMTPMFTPACHEWGPPPIYLAALGDAMLRLTGEIADGLITHPFCSADYVQSVTLPAVVHGAARMSREISDIAIVCSVLVATGGDSAEIVRATDEVKRSLSFYASTPAYLPVLDFHGWGHIHERLRTMSKQGAWQEMADSFPDELVTTLAVVGTPDEVGAELVRRYRGLATRLSLNLGLHSGPEVHRAVLAAFRAAQAW